MSGERLLARPPALELYLPRRAPARFLTATIVVLHLANLPAVWFRHFAPDFPLRDLYIRLFYVSSEARVPTLYSALTLLTSAILLALIARTSVRDRRHWYFLAFVFVGMAFDEAAAIHERMGGTVLRFVPKEGIFRIPWVVPGLGFVAVVGTAYIPFLRRREPRTRRLFVIAGLLYLGGVLGMEMAGALTLERYGPSLAYEVVGALEEVLEMSGIAVFICALLRVLRNRAAAVTLNLGARV